MFFKGLGRLCKNCLAECICLGICGMFAVGFYFFYVLLDMVFRDFCVLDLLLICD